jgi:septum formation protein
MQNKRKIVLASESFKRKQLLEQIGLVDFEIRASEYEEDMTLDKEPIELAKFLALRKGRDVAKHYQNAIIISGDTIAVFEGKVFGKPKDKQEAVKMLKLFSGKKVGCLSALALIDTKNKKEIVTDNIGWMKFRKLSLKEIKNYVETEENVLKFAGGFGLMNKAAVLIESVEGDFFSIIALPIEKLYLGLKKLGVDVLDKK